MIQILQRSLVLPAKPRGIHLITSDIQKSLPELEACSSGVLTVFIQHTSASLTINENASPEVRRDLDMFLDQLVPDGFDGFEHTLEGPDDMPAHVKASLMSNSLSIPVTNGELALGMWQGVYLCEHRNRGGRRKLLLSVTGAFSRAI